MMNNFTLEYWIDEDWYIGRLKEVPSVFSQAETLEGLQLNIQDAYEMMQEEAIFNPVNELKTKKIPIQIH
ncbi:MAG: type II toxin-antitoxin system HicB family antitoxin [Gammaproteobacteria bacterium]|nr:MAG: type II toxin-antitoxin system HicB family antitoxin [Gammaproteobacteria bacterium]